ncbi:hypothetical protein SDC9_157388 [bioreactor metagenome]|uniref:Uncharacterized protein n=1 Tax=bioreactor metagenome TaxID=1076179 RepID=A0A645F6U7_9ZZZZ
MDQDAGAVGAVIGVAGDVAAALQQQHPLAAALCQLSGGNGSGKARADDQAVKSCIHETSPFRDCGLYSAVHHSIIKPCEMVEINHDFFFEVDCRQKKVPSFCGLPG